MNGKSNSILNGMKVKIFIGGIFSKEIYKKLINIMMIILKPIQWELINLLL
jgi:hypothetical protein